ncbi:hypothetical protein BCAM1859 [Burkholderia cenocepacia J2315]|uniref:Uncharacterized protein n=1 Tax=Burkholderia cenocepacia (strain ATCC BAA-245 / DSM 16553 / LMG 16656 / NCTC 13227 / J2315 / CF5610) TaxID=216591 RepID=B4EMC1_BURCJ|nr:hypothetical protein BCAM1859 [Burkholderia cenocepacia J2315]
MIHERPMQAIGRACGTLPHERKAGRPDVALRSVPQGLQMDSIDRPVPIGE